VRRDHGAGEACVGDGRGLGDDVSEDGDAVFEEDRGDVPAGPQPGPEDIGEGEWFDELLDHHQMFEWASRLLRPQEPPSHSANGEENFNRHSRLHAYTDIVVITAVELILRFCVTQGVTREGTALLFILIAELLPAAHSLCTYKEAVAYAEENLYRPQRVDACVNDCTVFTKDRDTVCSDCRERRLDNDGRARKVSLTFLFFCLCVCV
jgi:hypothetical protein